MQQLLKREQVHSQHPVPGQSCDTIQDAFAQLDISPFTKASVRNCKCLLWLKINVKAWALATALMVTGALLGLGILAMAMSLLMWFMWAVLFDTGRFWAWMCLTSIVVTMIMALVLYRLDRIYCPFGKWEWWEWTSKNGDQIPRPNHPKRQVMFEQYHPAVFFYVEEIRDRDTRYCFLVVQDCADYQCYYIDYWESPVRSLPALASIHW